MIFLLSGWSGSGKDATASVLVKKYKYIRLAFADILKEMVAQEFDFPLDWTKTEAGKQMMLPHGKTVRECLIQRGQEIRQEMCDPGFFARRVSEKIKAFPSNQNVVIPDWRFPVELETLEEELSDRHIFQIRIQRLNQESSGVEDEFTEHQLDFWPFEFILQNPGTSIKALSDSVEKFMNNYCPIIE
jgi:hypothetical protein